MLALLDSVDTATASPRNGDEEWRRWWTCDVVNFMVRLRRLTAERSAASLAGGNHSSASS